MNEAPFCKRAAMRHGPILPRTSDAAAETPSFIRKAAEQAGSSPASVRESMRRSRPGPFPFREKARHARAHGNLARRAITPHSTADAGQDFPG